MNAVMPSVAKEGQPPEDDQKNDCLCNHRSSEDAAPPLVHLIVRFLMNRLCSHIS